MTTQPLADPRLEAAAQMLLVWLNADSPEEMREEIESHPDDALAFYAEARKQTGADEAFAALRELTKAGEQSVAKIIASASGFVNDPPDSDYQRGYLAAVQVIAEENLQRIADALPKARAALAKYEGVG